MSLWILCTINWMKRYCNCPLFDYRCYNNKVMFFQYPDPKKIQINLTGFLQGKNAREFMAELWALLISAQENPAGIPDSLLDLKKEELAKKKVNTILYS